MDVTIEKLIKRRDKHFKKSRKLSAAIETLREVCKHEWKANGYDSHKDHYICTKCGKTDYV